MDRLGVVDLEQGASGSAARRESPAMERMGSRRRGGSGDGDDAVVRLRPPWRPRREGEAARRGVERL